VIHRALSREQFVALVELVTARGGLLRCRVRGQSMRPAVGDLDDVVLGPVDRTTLAVGDIVLARTRRGPKLHRIVDQGDGWVRVRGDMQPGAGQTITPDTVVARLVKVERPLSRTLALYWDHFIGHVPWLRSRPVPVLALRSARAG
jgi:hypothetical protein